MKKNLYGVTKTQKNNLSLLKSAKIRAVNLKADVSEFINKNPNSKNYNKLLNLISKIGRTISKINSSTYECKLIANRCNNLTKEGGLSLNN